MMVRAQRAAALAAAIIGVAMVCWPEGVAAHGVSRRDAAFVASIHGPALAEAGGEPVAAPGPAAPPPPSASYQNDVYTVELRPFEGVEYKYRLAQGGGLVYAWDSTGKVEFEFHGEPDGAPPKYFDSYSKGTGTTASGRFVAAKAGIHGWYWKNPGATRVTVTLKTAGFYATSTEYRDGDRIERKFTDR